MNLYLIWQNKNCGYDTYDSAVVAAENEAAARLIHPYKDKEVWDGKEEIYGTWCDSKHVKVEFIGTASLHTQSGVICASFNAG